MMKLIKRKQFEVWKENGITYISHICHCSRCEEMGEKDVYMLKASCYNCGEKHIAVLRKEDRASSMDECPFCKVSDLTYGTWQEARDMEAEVNTYEPPEGL